MPPSDPPPQEIEPDSENIMGRPWPIILSSFMCFVLAFEWFTQGKDLADWLNTSLIFIAGVLILIRGRVIWWFIMLLLAIMLFTFLDISIDRLRNEALWLEQADALLSLLLSGIIVGQLLRPTSRNFYREAPEGD
ncbi:hypothetical protein [Bremerella sp.]|uniref:hypothetical protein n=1 Tax=Bremerella sp. TaxID=2795602 RepID=UPI00391D97D9